MSSTTVIARLNLTKDGINYSANVGNAWKDDTGASSLARKREALMFAALLLALVSQPVSDGTLDDPVEISCYSKARSSKDMETCGIQALTRAERDMNLFWGNTLAEYGNDNPHSAQLLKKAQAEWLSYRRSWCDVVAHDNHGSNRSRSAGCQAKLTRQRTQAIKELIKGTNE